MQSYPCGYCRCPPVFLKGVFLDGALERLGLNVRERCDMITYWLPQLESSPFNVIYFVQTALYEKAPRLTVVPTPDVCSWLSGELTDG